MSADEFGAPAKAHAGDGIERDQWGRYLLPDPTTGIERAYTRATTIARTLADEYGLSQWRQRLVAAGVARRPDLIALAASCDPDEDKARLKDVVESAAEVMASKAGANMGTALHNYTRDLDRGFPLGMVPEVLHADLDAYRQLMLDFDLKTDPRYLERVVCCPSLDAAGTTDKFVLCADGFYRVLDTKTAKSLEFSYLEIAVQEAIYANAEYLWNVSAQCYEPMPEPLDRTMGLVLWMPVGKGAPQLYAVNLTAGLAAANVAIQVRAMRKAAETLFMSLSPPIASTPEAYDEAPAEIVDAAVYTEAHDSLNASEVDNAVELPSMRAEPTDENIARAAKLAEAARGTEDDRARLVLDELLLMRLRTAASRSELEHVARLSAEWLTDEHRRTAYERWEALAAPMDS